MEAFDHIIIGTGQATGTLLGKLIPTGGKIAVIEGGRVGGSCVNYGCTPTKTLVASAKAIYKAKQGDLYGFKAGDVKIDYARIRDRMNEIRYGNSDGFAKWMEDTESVTLIRDWATFIGKKTLKAGDRTLTGEKIYINTGTRPAAPPIKGLEEVDWMDSAKLLDLEELPEHLLIIGGGYIGMEFSQVFRRLGSKVTVIQRGSRIMPNEDEDVSNAIQDFLEEEGIVVHCNASAKSAKKSGKKMELIVVQNGSEMTLSGSHLLIAAGRKPNTEQLNPEATGVHTNERGYIVVDEKCRTEVEGIFALGDVNGRGAFTHTSVNDAEIVIDHLYGTDTRRILDRIPVYALFTDPPLGRVGLSEQEALSQGKKIMKATKPMREIARAREMSETKGFAKLIVDAETDLILGASILGPGGDEIVNMFAAIMHSQIPCREYRNVVLVHPTISELMPWVLDGLKPVNLP